MEENIGTMLAQVSRLFRRRFDERARGIGVTRPQWHTLALLYQNPGINQGRLAYLLEVEPITLGRMIDRLQESGLVERRDDPSDRRAWLIYLTDKGVELHKELRPLAQEMVDAALEGLDAAEQDQLRRLLGRIRSNLAARCLESSEAG